MQGCPQLHSQFKARLSWGGGRGTGSNKQTNKGRKKWEDAYGHVSEQVGKLFRELHQFPDGITAGGKSLGR